MDYWFEHAQDIMYLCFGGGFVLLVLFTIRTLLIATRVLKKLDDLTDIFIEYIQKPIRLFLEAQKVISKLLEWWKK